MTERNKGHWEYRNFFTYNKWREVELGTLERHLADRYDTVNKVRYVGPEVEATNRLVDRLLK